MKKNEAPKTDTTDTKPKFTLTDEAPPAMTRKGGSVYRAIITEFIESDLAHARVTLPDHSGMQVYNGLRTAFRAVPEYAKRAKVIRRGADNDESKVYLIRTSQTA